MGGMSEFGKRLAVELGIEQRAAGGTQAAGYVIMICGGMRYMIRDTDTCAIPRDSILVDFRNPIDQ